MSKAKKELTHQLVAVLEPYLVAETATGLAPEVIAKVLRKLARQVLAPPSQKSVAKATTPSPVPAKAARQQVVATLTSEVEGYVGTTEKPGKGAAKALTKTIKRLAKQVVKQQRKQVPPVAAGSPAPVTALAKAKRAAAPRPPVAGPPAPPAPSTTRRSPAKRAVAKAALDMPVESASSAQHDASKVA